MIWLMMLLAYSLGLNLSNLLNEEAMHFYQELEKASRPLWVGSQHSKLYVAVRMINIKLDWTVAEAAMDSMIKLVGELVTPEFDIPKSYYQAKRLVSKLGLSYDIIHCFPNSYMLFYKQDANLNECKLCGHAHYRWTPSGKMVPIKAMHYLPIICRLKRLFASLSSTPHMRWHNENRRTPGVICHPSDEEVWKHFDRTYPDFASEPRANHGVGGVVTYDVSTKSNFNMHASLMWTINDFPTYGMLSSWMTAAKLACPHSMEKSKAFTLKHGHKNSWFVCHLQFLPMDHEFRKMKQAFRKNKTENDPPPRAFSGEEIWGRVCHLLKVTEVTPSRLPGYGVEPNWTKQSIFWELPYWKDNLLRHNLDAMHIEKNYFDNLFNTVMDVKGKTKDNQKARLDLKEYCRRPELNLQELAKNKVFKPRASFSFTMEEKREICQQVKNLRMPEGYASNFDKRADMNEGKLIGMKSHDCYVFMETLIPIA
ncbi:uncharacterized protein LOC132045446 [Lycium ferocissimum]|uniref:uncharacterized protein LOC132045446 n=1 Tax=Lycium ferocissimum TaxID=112874 RepID=UPI0028153D0C|nr:uncharacterized protein LOC132045446 [Lycium ferocissimum]